MEADITSQDRFYRRGLVLGFTLAEIAILIIFALLLALSWHLTEKDKEIEKLGQRLDEREILVAGLTQRIEDLQERFARGDDFDDLFQELVQKKERVAEQERTIQALHEKSSALEREKQALAERVRGADRLIELAQQAGISADDWEEVLDEIGVQLDQLQKMKEGLAAAGLKDSEVEAFAKDTLETLREAEAKVGMLDGQLQDLRSTLKYVGKGMVMPPCWTTQEDEEEYTFSVTIRSTDLLVEPIWPPHRSKQLGTIGAPMLKASTTMGLPEFGSKMRPFYDFGKAADPECRFFVTVRDETGPTEKKAWQDGLEVIESVFYKRITKSKLPPPPVVAPMPATTRWVGGGPEDACGKAWFIRIAVSRGMATGQMVRGGVGYDVTGEVGAAGELRQGRASKSKASIELEGPFTIQVNVEFGPQRAVGDYAIEGSRQLLCRTPISLHRQAG